MNNKKGFTLIELLAVIVILAILILLAMPAVTSIMESSGRNTFKNEILGVVKTMESAYTEKWGNGDIVSTFDDDAKIHTVTKDDKTYSYLCMSLKQLYEEQYIKKNLGDNYGGYIQMYIGENDTYTYINTTNGTYYMQGEYGALSASTYEPNKSNNGKEVTKATTCPSDENDLDTPGTGGSTGGETGEESGSGGESGEVAEYKYWRSKTHYNSTSVPSEVFDDYRELVASGANSTLIRTTYENGSPVKHEVCLYYRDKLFCLAKGYWELVVGSYEANSETTEAVKNALRIEMENKFETSVNRCYANSNDVYCFFEQNANYCNVYNSGYERCYAGGSRYCYIEVGGSAYCYW